MNILKAWLNSSRIPNYLNTRIRAAFKLGRQKKQYNAYLLMLVRLCSVLSPENWSASLPNKGNSLSTSLNDLH